MLPCRFQQSLWPVNRLAVEDCSKTGPFEIFKETRFSESIILEIHKLWGWSFCSKCLKCNVSFRKAMKNSIKCFSFSDYCISLGSCKFPLLRQEYLSSAVNMLASRSLSSDLITETFCDSICLWMITQQDNNAVLQISVVFWIRKRVDCVRIF